MADDTNTQPLAEDYFKHYISSPPPKPTEPEKPAVAGAKSESSNVPLEVAGAGALATGAGILGSRFPALRRAAAETARFISEHPTLGAGSVGAVTGGAAATPEAVSSGHPGDILVGAGLGAGAGMVGTRAGMAAPQLIRRFGVDPAERAVAEAELKSSADAKAASSRLRSLSQEMRATARGKNPNPQTVGDVLSPPGQALAEAALRDPAKESQDYAAQLAARQAGSPGRVEEAVNQGLAPDKYADAEQQMVKTMKDNAAPLYQAAYSQFPSVQSDELQTMLGTKYGKAAAKKAFQLMQADGVPIGQADATGMIRNPSLQFLDYVKRGLDDMVGASKKAGNNNEARIIKGMKDRFLSEIDEKTTPPNGVSPYATARAQYSSDREVLDALHSGLEDFPSMTPEEVKAAMLDMGPGLSARKDAFRSGVAEHLFRTVGKTSTGGNAAKRVIPNLDTQVKVASLFDDPKEAQQFIDTLQRESDTFEATKSKLAAAKAGPAAAVQPSGGLPLTVGQVGAHSLTFHPKIMALRAAAHTMLPWLAGKIPAGGISDIMSRGGYGGAETLGRLADTTERLEALKNWQQRLGGIGGVGTGAAAGAALTPEIARHYAEQP